MGSARKPRKAKLKNILNRLAFDPNVRPWQYATDSANPVYATSRALEVLSESDDKVKAIQYLVLAILLEEEANGPKETS